MAVDKDWSTRVETRLAELERMLGTNPETAEIDAMIRDAFRAWLAFGRFAKWVVYVLAATAGAMTAGKVVAAQVKTWIVG